MSDQPTPAPQPIHTLADDQHNITVAALRFVALNREAQHRDATGDETAGEWWLAASEAYLALGNAIAGSGYQLDATAARYDQPMWWSETDLSDMQRPTTTTMGAIMDQTVVDE